MIRHLIAAPLKLALSATLALALSITPVSANDWGSRSDNNDDVTTMLGILLGLATVGAILSNQNDQKDRADKRRHPPKREYKRVQRVPRHLQLPAQCLVTYRTQQGKQRYFSQNCLNRSFSYASGLPRACRETIVARNQSGTYVTRRVYRSSCLNDRGYRTKGTY